MTESDKDRLLRQFAEIVYKYYTYERRTNTVPRLWDITVEEVIRQEEVIQLDASSLYMEVANEYNLPDLD